MNSSSIPTRHPLSPDEIAHRMNESKWYLNDIVDLAESDFLPPAENADPELLYNETNFMYCDLARSYLHDADYSGSVFDFLPAVHIHNANMQNTTFKEAKIHGSTLTETDFTAANFQFANMARLVAENCKFEGARFDDVNWKNGKLLRSHASHATFRRSDLSGLNASYSEFVACNFQAALLNNVNFSSSSLAHANLMGARLRGTILEDTDLTGANLHGVLFGPDTLAGEYHLKTANTETIEQCLWQLCERCPRRALIERYVKQLSNDEEPIKNVFSALDLEYSPILFFNDHRLLNENNDEKGEKKLTYPLMKREEAQIAIQLRMEYPLAHPEWIVRLFLNGLIPLVDENEGKPHPEFNPFPIRHILKKWLEQWLSSRA